MKQIAPLVPPDSFHLSAAEGWFELGNHLEANEELEHIPPQLRVHPDVLALRWQIYAKENEWPACVSISTALTQLVPGDSDHWLRLANSLRNVPGTGVAVAREVLLLRVDHFPQNPFFLFYLACCCAQLNLLVESHDWWDKALIIAKTNGMFDEIRLKALDEPDLEPLLKMTCQHRISDVIVHIEPA
jgi:hypothetical protein